MDKCCGNCKHFIDEDIDGIGYCSIYKGIIDCHSCCSKHDEKMERTIKRIEEELNG